MDNKTFVVAIKFGSLRFAKMLKVEDVNQAIDEFYDIATMFTCLAITVELILFQGSPIGNQIVKVQT